MKFFGQLDWAQSSEAKACEHTVQHLIGVPYRGRMGLYRCADCRIEIIRPYADSLWQSFVIDHGGAP
jgi:hypothetical protein